MVLNKRLVVIPLLAGAWEYHKACLPEPIIRLSPEVTLLHIMKPMRLTHLPKVLIISCGALAREILAVLEMNGWRHMDLTCLPAEWHFTPKKIPEGMRQKIRENRSKYDEILCIFGDCGTGGELDRVLEQEGVERIAGDHCYAFYAGLNEYAAMDKKESGTLYLTDFFVRYFDTFVIRYLGLDRHPELRDDYFANFTRVIYLAQTSSDELNKKAMAAANRISLRLEICRTGLDGIEGFLVKSIARANPVLPEKLNKSAWNSSSS